MSMSIINEKVKTPLHQYSYLTDAFRTVVSLPLVSALPPSVSVVHTLAMRVWPVLAAVAAVRLAAPLQLAYLPPQVLDGLLEVLQRRFDALDALLVSFL
jgi:hypothetical protein